MSYGETHDIDHKGLVATLVDFQHNKKRLTIRISADVVNTGDFQGHRPQVLVYRNENGAKDDGPELLIVSAGENGHAYISLDQGDKLILKTNPHSGPTRAKVEWQFVS